MHVLWRDAARLELEKDQPVVGGGLSLDAVVDLDEFHVLREFGVGGQNRAAAVIEKRVELLRVGDVRHGTVGARVAEEVANGREKKVFSRVSRHSCRVRINKKNCAPPV